jgi:ElaB/YqjD/DUF883 family membrane-anchored ribosome-binding protein
MANSSEAYSPGGSSGARATGEQLRQKAGEVRESIGEMGGIAKEAAREKLGELRETATHAYQRGRERAGEAVKGVEHYIQEQPIKSLLMAAGLGLLVGFFLRRS